MKAAGNSGRFRANFNAAPNGYGGHGVLTIGALNDLYKVTTDKDVFQYPHMSSEGSLTGAAESAYREEPDV